MKFKRPFSMAPLLFVVVVGLIVGGVAATSNLCQCSSLADSSHHQQRRELTEVAFLSAEVSGEEYIRPRYGSPKHQKKPGYFGANNEDLSPLCDAEQIHVSLGGDGYGSIVFSFVSANVSLNTPSNVYVSLNEESLKSDFEALESGTDKNVLVASGIREAYSELIYIYSFLYAPPMGAPMQPEASIVAMENTMNWAYDKETGEHWAMWRNVTNKAYTGFGDFGNPYMYYDSPYIHTAYLSGLSSGVTYYYRVSGSCVIYSFVIPLQAQYPFLIGLTGDVGQTEVSQRSFTALEALDPEFVLLVGDLSYADGFPTSWDSFGNMIESFAAENLILTTSGNHEYGFGENAVSYGYRYPTPFRGSGSSHFCYWGREVGVIHIVALCSYAGFWEDSLQYAWLKKYLSTKINRDRTPWLVVMMHTPFYNSNGGHWMEGELMRRAMEPILYDYGVDLVLSGHVHAYERSYPVFNNTLDDCGITYVNLGDGGNYEGTYATWRNDDDSKTKAPFWSAFREGSFGIAGLEFYDATTANYSWHRHACGSSSAANYHMNFSDHCETPNDNSAMPMLTSDSFLLVRPPQDKCPNRYVSTSSSVDDISTVDDKAYDDDAGGDVIYSDDDGGIGDKKMADTILALMIVAGALLLLCVGVMVELTRVNNKIAMAQEATSGGGNSQGIRGPMTNE